MEGRERVSVAEEMEIVTDGWLDGQRKEGKEVKRASVRYGCMGVEMVDWMTEE